MSIRKHYDEALAELNQALIEMGQAVTDAVENAMEALATTDAEAAAQIIKDDNQVNEMEHDIEHRCMVLLLRQQPADIAEIMPHLFASRKAGDPAVSEAIKMGQKAHKMVQDGMDAFLKEDMNAAQKVIAADDEVDYDFNAIKRTLAEEIAADPSQVDAALDLLMVIKYLERMSGLRTTPSTWPSGSSSPAPACTRTRLCSDRHFSWLS